MVCYPSKWPRGWWWWREARTESVHWCKKTPATRERETPMPCWPCTEPSLLCFSHIYWVQTSLQRGGEEKTDTDQGSSSGRSLCLCLICDAGYLESGSIVSNRVMLVKVWLSAVLHDRHHSPPNSFSKQKPYLLPVRAANNNMITLRTFGPLYPWA